jgi:hypothetical protein
MQTRSFCAPPPCRRPWVSADCRSTPSHTQCHAPTTNGRCRATGLLPAKQPPRELAHVLCLSCSTQQRDIALIRGRSPGHMRAWAALRLLSQPSVLLHVKEGHEVACSPAQSWVVRAALLSRGLVAAH